MNKIFLTILFFAIVCRGQNDVTLTIKNNHLNYATNDSLRDKFHDSHYLIEEKLGSQNIVEFTIKNNSSKDLLFLMDPYNPSFTNDDFKQFSFNSLYYKITDFKGKSRNLLSGAYKLEKKEYLKILYERRKIDSLQYLLNKDLHAKTAFDSSFLLKAHDSVSFTFTISLPVTKEPSVKNDFDLSIVELNKDRYTFQLVYNFFKKDIPEYIGKKELEYLKNHKIEVFTGLLESNKILILPN